MCTDITINVADNSIQVHGGTGYIEESDAPQFLRDSRTTATYEGTKGIQAMDLVRQKVAGDGGVAVRALIDVIRSADKDLAAVENAYIQVIRGSLALAVADLTNATNWLVETYPLNPSRVAAGAVLYLRLLGKVVSGWLMPKVAAKTAQELERGSDRTFLSAKIKSARYFADIRLSESGVLRRKFLAAGDGLLGPTSISNPSCRAPDRRAPAPRAVTL